MTTPGAYFAVVFFPCVSVIDFRIKTFGTLPPSQCVEYPSWVPSDLAKSIDRLVSGSSSSSSSSSSSFGFGGGAGSGGGMSSPASLMKSRDLNSLKDYIDSMINDVNQKKVCSNRFSSLSCIQRSETLLDRCNLKSFSHTPTLIVLHAALNSKRTSSRSASCSNSNSSSRKCLKARRRPRA